MRLLLTFTVTAAALSSGQVLETRQSDWRVGQTVSTSSGPVTGHDAGNDNVSEYLGIPYAKPPVGDLRFAAPQKFEGSVPINATKFVSNLMKPRRKANISIVRIMLFKPRLQ